jgi:phosphoribosylaminoimidazole-succinocarboxamide synthase
MTNQTTLSHLLAEGKTKKIWATSCENEVLIENKDSITTDNGRRQTSFMGKAALATHITANCFRLLHRAGIATHFLRKENCVTFRAQKLTMIPIEIVVRRIAFGSYSERNPTVKRGSRLEILVVEFFHKNNFLHDPLLKRVPDSHSVLRYNARLPLARGHIDECSPQIVATLAIDHWSELKIIACRTFEVLEAAWAAQNMTLADMKIECGFAPDGRLVVGDVIDNDSWRLWFEGNPDKAVDKHLYIDGRSLNYVAQQYARVADATNFF